jgi:succinoglycan biosynthesis protein ExoA
MPRSIDGGASGDLSAFDALERPPTGLVTVVVPARNEEASIEQCLRSVTSQDYRDLQILVVDSCSSDRTVEVVEGIARRDGRVELIECPARSIPRALNTALSAARGRWLVRVDAHSTIPEDYVRRAVEHLRDGGWGGVGGRKNGVGQTAAGHAIAAAMGSRFGVGGSVYHHGTAARTVNHIPFGSYPTDVVRSLGGWDERLAANEDFEFDHRLREAGHRLLFDPSMEITWSCRQSIPDLFRQYRRYGRAKATVVRLHPDSLTLSHLAPPALVASVAVAGVAALRRPLAALLPLLPYGACLAAASIVTARRVEAASARVRVPVAFMAMHVGWGLGFWEGVASMLRRGGTIALRAPADPSAGNLPAWSVGG